MLVTFALPGHSQLRLTAKPDVRRELRSPGRMTRLQPGHADSTPSRAPRRAPADGQLRLPQPIGEVFAFFSNPRNLERITPPWLSFHVMSAEPQRIQQGSLIDYRLRVRGLPLRWRSEIRLWDQDSLHEQPEHPPQAAHGDRCPKVFAPQESRSEVVPSARLRLRRCEASQADRCSMGQPPVFAHTHNSLI